jgi:hypothetical protein
MGRLLLERIPESAFRIGFKTILTLLSLRLLYDSAGALIKLSADSRGFSMI